LPGKKYNNIKKRGEYKLKITFNSAKKAEKFWKTVNKWRIKILKSILIALWMGFFVISLISLAEYCKRIAGGVPLWMVFGAGFIASFWIEE